LVAGDVFKRPAQVFFAGPVGVDVGGVKEVNSGVEGVVDDAIARLFIQGLGVGGAVAKAHAAQAEFRDLNVGVANCCVSHGYFPYQFNGYYTLVICRLVRNNEGE